MTESGSGAVGTRNLDIHCADHCGGSFANVKIKLRDVPEMGYLSTNNPPQGEVCLKGMQITKGYYKNPEKTKEAFVDGWFCTGDIATINPNGSLKIVDRAKNIFKLSQGEYIAPDKLENIYATSDWFMQCWIHGDSMQNHIILFAVIDEAYLDKYLSEEATESSALNPDKTALLEDRKFQSLVY